MPNDLLVQKKTLLLFQIFLCWYDLIDYVLHSKNWMGSQIVTHNDTVFRLGTLEIKSLYILLE